MKPKKHLIYEYKKNNELDLERIMNDFEGYVRTIINNIAFDKLTFEDKEEILSDTFFILWKNQSKVSSSIEAYVAGITRILVKEKLRKRKVTYDISDYENLANTIEFINEDILENDRIERIINKLKKVDIKIITMFYYNSKSTKEIANELKLSEINVRTRLFRIRNKIRKELK